MAENRNQNQIVRKDARNCFVESLSDAFEIGRIHLAFATYDLSKPAGQRQTNNCSVLFFHLTWDSNTVALCLYGIVVWHPSLFQDSCLLQFYIRLYHRYMFLFFSSN